MKSFSLSLITVVAGLLFLSPISTCGQTQVAGSPAEQEVRKLERAWLDAYEKRDTAAMNAIVADDFVITFADGSMQTKSQVVDSIKGPGGSSKFYTENVQSRQYGDTVILIGVVVSEWKQNDKPMTDRSRYTDTYVRRNGRWQVVASHLSKIGK